MCGFTTSDVLMATIEQLPTEIGLVKSVFEYQHSTRVNTLKLNRNLFKKLLWFFYLIELNKISCIKHSLFLMTAKVKWKYVDFTSKSTNLSSGLSQ
ncbi:unnamed protein product [Adineta ricciae]|uniref:Uncharacterized protein n=1 Tax=Adineta ricciae TaxID=249248 RepID=A0A815TD78_ADIRI|nr:unnamed protein product [Adineta ricciae]